jgi:hypothetical protein
LPEAVSFFCPHIHVFHKKEKGGKKERNYYYRQALQAHYSIRKEWVSLDLNPPSN